MQKRIYGSEYGFQTRAVHTGNDVDGETGAIKRPITMAYSYELPYDPTDMNWSSAAGNLYTRNGGSNQKYLQEKLASLEGGEGGRSPRQYAANGQSAAREEYPCLGGLLGL